MKKGGEKGRGGGGWEDMTLPERKEEVSKLVFVRNRKMGIV